MKANCILIDPPWTMTDQLKNSDVKRGASSNYKTMSLNDIKNLNIKDIADEDNCVLCLWSIGSMLEDCLSVMKAWGFEQKQVYVWVKTKKKTVLTKFLDKAISNVVKKTIKTDNIINDILGEKLLAFYMGRLFRQTHEICLIGTMGKVYKNLKNKSQRSVCFDENVKHSAKPEKLQDSLDIMFGDCKKVELFARRSRQGWICAGNENFITMDEDIKISINKIKNISDSDAEKFLKITNKDEAAKFWKEIS